jgi:hypothetical protein
MNESKVPVGIQPTAVRGKWFEVNKLYNESELHSPGIEPRLHKSQSNTIPIEVFELLNVLPE